MTVTDVHPFSTAYKKGLRKGDRIVKVCNERVDRCKIQDVEKKLGKELHVSMEVESATAADASAASSEVSDFTQISYLELTEYGSTKWQRLARGASFRKS